jgi:protein gp37
VGEKTGIAWCHHTFNPWWGCVKVSPACDHCYAEAWAKRTGLPVWGHRAPRRLFGDAHWNEPLKWNHKAEQAGERRRVFCGSMCDVMEAHPDPVVARQLETARLRLYSLIEETSWLDWLLLTKRPQNFPRFLPPAWLQQPRFNVWLLTTVESQEYMWRVVELLRVPAVIHGCSYEPALGAANFAPHLAPVATVCGLDGIRPRTAAAVAPIARAAIKGQGSRYLDWLICGSESGPKARPSPLDYFRSARDQCQATGTSFFMKQITERGQKIPFDEWPEDLQVREFPHACKDLKLGRAGGQL